MSGKHSTPPDLDELGKALERFTKQGDRGTALIAAAWLDDSLELRIRAAFRPNKGTADELFDGPLATFAARIKFAYLMGLIEPFARSDLDRIRRIRNEFAHSRTELFFRSQ